MMKTATVIPFEIPAPALRTLDSQNRRRLARYEMKKGSLTVNPRTFFNLEFLSK